MFKKMKRRLVFWNMLLLVIVFAVILLAIAVITTVNSYRDTREMLKITLAASQFPAGGFHEPPRKEGMSGGIPMSAITVRCDGSGTVLGIKAKVTLVAPKSLKRYEGKSKRIVDLRGKEE